MSDQDLRELERCAKETQDPDDLTRWHRALTTAVGLDQADRAVAGFAQTDLLVARVSERSRLHGFGHHNWRGFARGLEGRQALLRERGFSAQRVEEWTHHAFVGIPVEFRGPGVRTLCGQQVIGAEQALEATWVSRDHEDLCRACAGGDLGRDPQMLQVIQAAARRAAFDLPTRTFRCWLGQHRISECWCREEG